VIPDVGQRDEPDHVAAVAQDRAPEAAVALERRVVGRIAAGLDPERPAPAAAPSSSR